MPESNTPTETTGPQSRFPDAQKASVNDSRSSDGSNNFGSLAVVASLVLAALQVIPAYVPKTLWTLVIVIVCVLGLVGYLFSKLRDPTIEGRTRKLAFVGLLFALACFSGYHIYSLRSEIANIKESHQSELDSLNTTHASEIGQLQEQVSRTAESKPIQDYLASVVKEGDDRWDGKFETTYARPTLYLLNDAGTREQPPLRMQEQLLLWRTGTAGIGPEFRAIAGLVGDVSINERNSMGLFDATTKQLNPENVVKGILNFVSRPLADSDLLNKNRVVSDSNADIAGDNIPERILVLADPAAGKTAMLQRLDLVQARRARGSKAEAVPVFISLSGMSRPTKEELLQKIRDRLGIAADDTLKTRKIILLVDALDEAADPVGACRAITELVAEYQNEQSALISRIIVTARLRNYQQIVHSNNEALWHHNFHTVILFGLDQTAIEKMILTRAPLEVRRRLFLKLAESRTRGAWLQFLRLPMNYELVAELLAESDSDILPQGQYQLIEKFIERRFNHRKISPADADHCKALLAIAASNQAALGIEKRSDTFDDAAFHREGDSSISASSLELRIRQMKDTGIIEERKPGRYRFFHQNILDFFIAKGLQDFTAIEPNRSEWREVILFRAGMPDGNRMLDHLEKLKADNFEIDESLMLEARRIIESNSQGQH